MIQKPWSFPNLIDQAMKGPKHHKSGLKHKKLLEPKLRTHQFHRFSQSYRRLSGDLLHLSDLRRSLNSFGLTLMPVAKLLGTSSADAMKAEEGSDSLDTFIKQAVGKEPSFSFSRTGDSPVQWIQLLHALDQQDLPGWPLLAPMKIQMQKCEKCAREFCSPVNYRRHIRVHRRSLKFHKESQKYRDLLGAFWDKLSFDEAKEIMSFKDVNLEEVPGSSIIRNIIANLRKPIFLSLPQIYVKAGSMLVDIIQGRPSTSRLPVSSQELFSILNDASETTFLSAGTAESLQKFVFDGEAGKIGLEIKNLIAATSFLFEQKLVKAWLADKDAEALRCQKLLVEEEEAAQRRQAEILERKKQRKLRQKEQRAKDQSNEVKPDLFETTTPSTETSSSPTFAEVDSFSPDDDEDDDDVIVQFSNNVEEEEEEEEEEDPNVVDPMEHQKVHGNDLHQMVARWQVPKSQKGGRNGFYGSKREQTHNKHREQRTNVVNTSKIWTKKPKPENGGVEVVKSRIQNDATSQSQSQSNCSQLMIGSISVTVRSPGQGQGQGQENGNTEVKKNSIQAGSGSGRERSTVKIWRPRHESRGVSGDSKVKGENGQSQTPPTCQSNDDSDGGNEPEAKLFSLDAAKAFLAQRWKEAISGEHSKLILSLSSSREEPPGENNESSSNNNMNNNTNNNASINNTNNVKVKVKGKFPEVPVLRVGLLSEIQGYTIEIIAMQMQPLASVFGRLFVEFN
ncbi:unnamed protein product [Lactuca saligna]|uniref:C2H2-type domain-containing protein n=1 Tax=Lactuca saligna TaxID=75948 RepID=A0AA36ENJ5_LACSI|nr:unnamed protein product [Lactuca saligna]